MLSDTDLQVEIPIRTTGDTGVPPTGELDTRTVSDACRDLYGERYTFTDPTLAGTLPARIGNNIAETSTSWTRLRGHHATQDGIHRAGDLAGSATCRTGFWMRTRFHR